MKSKYMCKTAHSFCEFTMYTKVDVTSVLLYTCNLTGCSMDTLDPF